MHSEHTVCSAHRVAPSENKIEGKNEKASTKIPTFDSKQLRVSKRIKPRDCLYQRLAIWGDEAAMHHLLQREKRREFTTLVR
ncbi:hypothetical protein POVCU2_0042830 [Plasmodium ovale curtisi]|uniref:Uncharacterized protein n=1 Tax=Plasmodium ovale curtisi TaxID=864141 RepID=A0A1A8W641_PLAOA|nr:hypothetical protein POVCU2_0042830 [Plasmodium ovale curtisi]SBT01932.1 hypothetical protein POVCU1_071040 [Plasmodium ovale curtisi]